MRTSIAGKLLLVAGFCLMTAVNAWKYQGHVLVARIAYDLLKEEDPQSLAKAEELLEALKDDYRVQRFEGDYRFVECAPVADDIKRRGGGFQQTDHYKDRPFTDEDGFEIPEEDNNGHAIDNAINAMVAVLQKSKGYKDTYLYAPMLKFVGNDEEKVRSLALRLLIHYVGDIHQPMHCINRFNSEYPQGDRGGNKVTLPTQKQIKELHAAWDSVLYEFPKNDKFPYTEDGWNTLGETVETLRSRVKINKAQFQTFNPTAWADECSDIAEKNAYEGVVAGQPLTGEYIAKNRKVAERQIVLAGDRLAKTIELVFSNSPSSKPKRRRNTEL